MTKEEALKLALEALESASNAIESWGSYASEYFQDKHDLQVDINNTQKAITSIKEALAQQEQETQGYREAAQLAKWLFKTHYAQQEHYASGRVIWGLCDTTSGVISQIDNMVCKLVLPKEPEQEPALDCTRVECMGNNGCIGNCWNKDTAPPQQELVCVCGAVWEGQELIYTTPQRTWVGLTDEEKQEWIDAMPYDPEPRHCMILVNVIEAKLKEKNHD